MSASEGNGHGAIIKVGKRGVRTFQYDDGTPERKLDVILVSNQWAEIDQSFRDEKGEVPRDKNGEYAEAAHKFAADILGVQAEDMSLADAYHFLQLLTKEAEALKPFFALATDDGPSSPASSVEVKYSE